MTASTGSATSRSWRASSSPATPQRSTAPQGPRFLHRLLNTGTENAHRGSSPVRDWPGSGKVEGGKEEERDAFRRLTVTRRRYSPGSRARKWRRRGRL
uniref:Uncharacterized protein n=1 Tax=Arundo donax TaxID=35708 RepID=A0A0A9IYP3_ARUDO